MKKRLSFTMAEILISLTIIGIIAAITLPSLRANINEKTWATQRKALYSRMSQAISMMPSLNGYGDFQGEWDEDVVTPTVDTAAARFVTDGLSKVLQINNICTIPMNTSSENARKELKKCCVSEKIKSMTNSKIDFPTRFSELNERFTKKIEGWDHNDQKNIDTIAAAFELNSGESVALFYNPRCLNDDNISSYTYNAQIVMCANFIYDLNGITGPNKLGRDIGFMTAIYPVDSVVVMPIVLPNHTTKVNSNDVGSACTHMDKNSRIPNIEELLSIFYNMHLIGMNESKWYWSSSWWNSNTRKLIRFDWGVAGAGGSEGEKYWVQCVKR